jgi:hypothetical protein
VIRPLTILTGVWIPAVTRGSSLHRKVQARSVASTQPLSRAYRGRRLQLITHIHLVWRITISKTILVLSTHAIMVTGGRRFLLRMITSYKTSDQYKLQKWNWPSLQLELPVPLIAEMFLEYLQYIMLHLENIFSSLWSWYRYLSREFWLMYFCDTLIPKEIMKFPSLQTWVRSELNT